MNKDSCLAQYDVRRRHISTIVCGIGRGESTDLKEEEMKKYLLLVSLIPVVAGLILAEYTPAQSAGTGKIAVMNPAIANTMARRSPLSPRLDTLKGKTLYLVDINWGDGATSVYEEMRDWFAKNNPEVRIVIKRKKGPYGEDDLELWKEIAQKGQAAIIGISG
jgi:hypothetical protein